MPIQIPHTPNPAAEQALVYRGRRGRPMLFQVTDPRNQPLYPYMLALHINPQSLGERMMKTKTVQMTKGGFVEWIWPDDLDTLSASATTGAFIGPETGLISGSDGRRSSSQSTFGTQRVIPGRHETIAWERQEDLLDLFHNNGIIRDRHGKPIFRGKIMCIYDRGIFTGHFMSFDVKETDEKAFSFELNWEFKVENTIYIFPGSQTAIDINNPFAGKAVLKTEAEDIVIEESTTPLDEEARRNLVAEQNKPDPAIYTTDQETRDAFQNQLAANADPVAVALRQPSNDRTQFLLMIELKEGRINQQQYDEYMAKLTATR